MKYFLRLGSKLRPTFPLAIIGITLFCSFIAISFARGLLSEIGQIQKLEENREKSEAAIQILTDGSDRLSFCVRKFTETKDLSYLDAYIEEAWGTKSREQAVQTLLQLDLTEQEKYAVLTAQKNSDELLRHEMWAMRLVCESLGLSEQEMPEKIRPIQLSPVEQRLSPEKKYALADNFIFGRLYYDYKNSIYGEVFSFRFNLNHRYGKATILLMENTRQVSRSSILLFAILSGLVLLSVLVYALWVASNERQLKLAKKDAEQANRAKTDFLSRMSHDMRTPLNGIIGMADLTLDEDISPVVRENLKKIDASGKFLLGLINDLLDMAKVESGKLELHPENYSFQKFKEYVDSILLPLFQMQGLTFRMFDVSECPPIYTDKLRFNQIFFNLLSNAAKFTPRGGTVEFQLHNARTADGVFSADYIVKDTGIGMEKAFQEHMFDAFSQESGSQQRGAGTGLGLSIVKKLVDMQHGQITVQSEKNRGTEICVHLDLPVGKTAEPLPLPSKELDESVLQGKRVLLCEDNPINTEIVCCLLAKKGISVDEAANGVYGLEKFKASAVGHYDAVLMDIRMPEMDGLQCAQEIRRLERPDAKTVPIIALTANAFADDEQKSHASGMNAHLAKPIAPALLYTTLMRVME